MALIDSTTGETLTEMSCADFAEHLWDTYDFHAFLSELRFLDEYSDDRCLEYMKSRAAREQVTLKDLDTWDYGKVFWTMYRESRC